VNFAVARKAFQDELAKIGGLIGPQAFNVKAFAGKVSVPTTRIAAAKPVNLGGGLKPPGMTAAAAPAPVKYNSGAGKITNGQKSATPPPTVSS